MLVPNTFITFNLSNYFLSSRLQLLGFLLTCLPKVDFRGNTSLIICRKIAIYPI